jgi:signal transduction histidine kinase/streptogramin lyase
MLLCPLEAQPLTGDYLAAQWTTREGLPSDSVTAVLRARDGYLWVGTTGGLARFDGVRFLPFKLASPTGATNTSITALCEDEAGRLWVGTQTEGLFYVTNATVRRLGAAEGLAAPGITCLAAAPGGELWIGTTAGLHHWQQNRMSRLTTAEGLPSNEVLSLNRTRSGSLWITTREGICRWLEGRVRAYDGPPDLPAPSGSYVSAYEDQHGDLWVFGDSFLLDVTQSKRFNYFRAGDPIATRVWTLHEARDGALWIGTSGRGLFRFKEGRFEAIRLPQGRLAQDVRAATTDEEGNIWLGTHSDGLVRLHPAELHWLEVKTKFPGPINALAEDAKGRLWVSIDGTGLYVIQEGHSEPVEVPGITGLRHVLAMGVGLRGALWLGTWGTGVYRLDENGAVQFTIRDGLSDDVVSAVGAARTLSAFVGTRSGDVHYFQQRERSWVKWGAGTLPRGITTLLHSRDQALWAGTDGGLWRIAHEKAAPECTPVALRNASIRALVEDRQGRLWVGTAADGLACINGSQVRLATVQNGLPHNSISQVVFDAQDNLWLGTERGIYKIPREAVNAFAAGEPLSPPCPVGQDELAADLRCLPGRAGAVSTREGRLCFATANGLAVVNPAAVRAAPACPPVYVEEVLVNGKSVRSPWSQAEGLAPLKLAYPLRSLEIHFTALGLRAPQSVKFRHQLEGYDADWNEEGLARLVRYGSLPSGRYRFRVKASDGTGAWNGPEATLSLLVPTPFWRAWWFLALTALVTAGSVAAGARRLSNRRLRQRLRRLQHEQAMDRERTRIARDMHDELGAKLTKVSFLSERLKSRTANAPELRQQIGTIAETSRSLLKSLDEIVWAVNPKNDTLEHLADYLGQYADEYFQNTAVECAVNLPEELPQLPLSAERRHNLFLAFEEALNNVLKHSQATRVRVTMKMGEGALEVTVADNGRGFQIPGADAPSAHPTPSETRGPGGNGLLNMQERLTEIGGHCRVTSLVGQGTRVELQLPLRNDSPLL